MTEIIRIDNIIIYKRGERGDCMVTALNVGNNLLKKGFSVGSDITPMKLQKLIYLVYKKFYQETGKILFSEPFEVWKYGPVVRSVYDEFKPYGSNAIKEYAKEPDGSVMVVDERQEDFKLALDYVWGKYGRLSGIRLSELTHKKGTAWWKAATEHRPYLSKKDIQEEEALWKYES